MLRVTYSVSPVTYTFRVTSTFHVTYSVSPVTYTFRVTSTFHVTCHIFRVTCYIHIPCHIHIPCYVSHIPCHLLHTHSVSHTYSMSHVTQTDFNFWHKLMKYVAVVCLHIFPHLVLEETGEKNAVGGEGRQGR